MDIDGQCHCGLVTYTATIDPDQVSICHCTDCQRLTGTAYRVAAMARRQDLRLTGHPPKLYTKRGANGRARLQYFCPECGSPLFTTGEGEDADIWGIRLRTINQRRMLTPSRQIWCSSALPWIRDLDGMPGVDED